MENDGEETKKIEKVDEDVMNDIFKDDDEDDDELFESSIDVKQSKKRKIQEDDETKNKKAQKKVEVTEKDDDDEDQSGDESEDEGEGDDADDNESEEGSENGDGGGDQVDDENEYEYDDFVVREGEGSDKEDEDEGSDNNSEKGSDEEEDEKDTKKSTKKRVLKRLTKRSAVSLEMEDLELIQDNAAAAAAKSRTTGLTGKLRKVASSGGDGDDEGEGREFNEEEETEIVPTTGIDKEEDDEDDEEEDETGGDNSHRRNHGYNDEDDEGSDMNDFLVDEYGDEAVDSGDEEGGAGRASGGGVVKKAQSVRRSSHRHREGPTFDQIKDATDIFGDGFDDFADEEEEEAAAAQAERNALEANGGIEGMSEQKARERLREKYDRYILVENFCTERDDVIRDEDRPERFQDILFNRSVPDEEERKIESEWMVTKLVHVILSDDSIRNGGLGRGNMYHRDLNLERELLEPIQNVLRYFQVDQLEPPFVWLYRQDYLHPRIRRQDLWRILSWDEQWERLYGMKQKIFELLRAIKDSADSRFVDKETMLREDTANRQKLRDVLNQVRLTQSSLELAEMEYQEALDLVEEKEDRDDSATETDRANVEIKLNIVDEYKKSLKKKEQEYESMKQIMEINRIQKAHQEQFIPQAAAEVLRLFPVEKYTTLITKATDESELKDISEFLTSFARAAVVKPVMKKSAVTTATGVSSGGEGSASTSTVVTRRTTSSAIAVDGMEDVEMDVDEADDDDDDHVNGNKTNGNDDDDDDDVIKKKKEEDTNDDTNTQSKIKATATVTLSEGLAADVNGTQSAVVSSESDVTVTIDNTDANSTIRVAGIVEPLLSENANNSNIATNDDDDDDDDVDHKNTTTTITITELNTSNDGNINSSKNQDDDDDDDDDGDFKSRSKRSQRAAKALSQDDDNDDLLDEDDDGDDDDDDDDDENLLDSDDEGNEKNKSKKKKNGGDDDDDEKKRQNRHKNKPSQDLSLINQKQQHGDDNLNHNDDINDDDDDEEDMAMASTTTLTNKLHKLTTSSRNSTGYNKFKSNLKLREFIELFTVPACEYGDSLIHNYKVEPPPTCETFPEIIAEKYIDHHHLKSALHVIRVITNMTALEYSLEPNIKKLTRDVFINDGSISTIPTKKGLAAITANSELFGYHYLDRKPLRDFFYGKEKEKTLFARLYEAERNDLIVITINPPASGGNHNNNNNGNNNSNDDVYAKTIDLFLDKKRFFHHFVPSENSHYDQYPLSRQKWDNLRIQILKLMFEKYLFPCLFKEIKRELIKLARENIIEQTAKQFQNLLKTGPYPYPPIENTREYLKEKLRSCPKLMKFHTVVGIYIVNGDKEPICCSYVDTEGNLKGHLLIPNILSITKQNEKIKQFLLIHQPEVIVINMSGGNLSKMWCRTLESVLVPEVSEAIENHKKERKENRRLNRSANYAAYDDDDDEEEDDDDNDDGGHNNNHNGHSSKKVYKPSVAIIHDEVASVFKRSPRAKKMFPDLQPGTCAAVCLARYAQEPLIEYCALWTSADAVEVFGYESLYLDLHPLKSLIKGVKLPILRALERCLVDAVCDIGVDLNKAVLHDHLAPMLAFIAGLGLRKADALRRKIRKTVKFVDSRKMLLERKLLSVNIWTNASGFLKICDDFSMMNQHQSQSQNDKVFDPLDNTRIHPECYLTYQCAQKLCCDALEVDSDPRYFITHVKKQIENSKKDLEVKMKRHPEWVDLWEKGVRPTGDYEQCQYFKDGSKEWRRQPVELDDAMSLLMLEDYAAEIEPVQGKRRLQLEQIKEELRYPWLDLRQPMNKLSDKDLFSIITGESDQTLYVGLKMGCFVIELKDYYSDMNGKRYQTAFVKTDSGLKGSISAYEVIDDRIYDDTFNLSDHLQVGMRMMGVVIGVNKVKGTIDLSIKPSYLSANESWWITNRSTDKHAVKWYTEQGKQPAELYDRYFLEKEALHHLRLMESPMNSNNNTNSSSSTMVMMSGSNSGMSGGYTDDEHDYMSVDSRQYQQQQQQQPYDGNDGTSAGARRSSQLPQQNKTVQLSMRQVHHPLFANCGYKEAEERLAREGKGAGEVIVRPSSKGPHMLAITWAFQAGVYLHIDVEERNKKEGNLGLANELIIKESDLENEVFSGLDEIYARYIEPMNDLVAAMIQNRCFRPGSVMEVEKSMYEEIDKNPNRIPYCIRFEPEIPGTFALTWIMKSSSKPVKKERIVIRPQGYRIKSELFARPNDLIQWFKKTANTTLETQQQLKTQQQMNAIANINQTVLARQQQQQLQQQHTQFLSENQPAVRIKSRLYSSQSSTAIPAGGSGMSDGSGMNYNMPMSSFPPPSPYISMTQPSPYIGAGGYGQPVPLQQMQPARLPSQHMYPPSQQQLQQQPAYSTTGYPASSTSGYMAAPQGPVALSAAPYPPMPVQPPAPHQPLPPNTPL